MATGGSERVMIVIGKTGNGKSATCNTLLKSTDFHEGKGGMSTTSDCKLVKKVVRGRVLGMIDTPGTRDVKNPQQALESLLAAVDLCPNGIDAFLVTFRSDVRATEEELMAVEEAVELFGPECFKRAIMVFTRGDEYDNDVTEFEEKLDETRSSIPRFDALLSKFSDRWVLMDNGNRCDPSVRERQVSALLNMVDEAARYNPRRYQREDQESLQQALCRRDELKGNYQSAIHNQMAMQAMRFKAELLLQSREFKYALEKQAMEFENERLLDQLKREQNKWCSLM